MGRRGQFISVLIQFIVWLGSSIFLLVGGIKGGVDTGRMIFYAWLAITTQANLNSFITDEKERNR